MERIIETQLFEDARGALCIMQVGEHVPFPIMRIFCITNVPAGGRRGFHAHLEVQECFLCLQGSCRILLDDGIDRREHVFDSPGRMLCIPPMLWIEITDFSSDCILLVACSEKYQPEKAISDHDEFKALAGRKRAAKNE